MLFEWLDELSIEDRTRRVNEAFKNVAATENGKIVFLTIFEDLHLFREVENPGQQALNNYAKFLIGYFGKNEQHNYVKYLLGTDKDAIYRVMEALLKQKEES